MSKSSDYDFVGLSTAMLLDVAVYFPNDRVEWSRDLSRITHLVANRGQSIFTIDLPKLGKALDASLASGRLDLTGLNHSGSRKKGSKIPRLFWGLWIRLFSDEGYLKQDIDPNVVALLRGLLYVGKKLEWECAPRYLYETVKEFFDVEAAIAPPSPQIWDEDDADLSRNSCGSLSDFHTSPADLFRMPERESWRQLHLLEVCQRVADLVAGDVGSLTYASLAFKHGPGAVSDLRRGKDYKYSFPTWSPRLETLFPFTEFGSVPAQWEELGYEAVALENIGDTGPDVDPIPSSLLDGKDPSLLEDADEVGKPVFVPTLFQERFSKLHAVPKTQTGPRLIAAEPTCNQWIQQGLARALHDYTSRRGSILEHSVSFTDQSASGMLALSASSNGRLCTIDLKSASDRLSTHVVQRMFRANHSLLRAMIACRTRFLHNTVDRSCPDLHKLRKFSTQGSALTFPVQSIVFASLCLGVGKFLNPKLGLRALSRLVRVFGDDIIVPTEWEPHLRQVLHLLGLRVNDTKTFTVGNFRESCGVDAWAGYDVSPPYVSCASDRTAPQSVLSNVAVSNNFYKKGWWHAASWIQETVGHRNIIPVIGINSGAFGFKSASGPSVSNCSWDDKTHKWTTTALSIVAKASVVKSNTAAALLEFFTTFGAENESRQLSPFVDYESGVVVAGTPKFRRSKVAVEELS